MNGRDWEGESRGGERVGGVKSWLVVRGEMGKRTRMRAGVGYCGVAARGVCAWSEAVWRERELERMRTGAIYRRRHIIRNAFAHNVIVIAVERKASYCVIAEKWLKRNYTMNGRDKQGEDGGVKERLKVREKIKNVKRLALVSCEIVDLVCSRL